MLLTGTDHHIAGFGNMAERVLNIPEQIGQPGYDRGLDDLVYLDSTITFSSNFLYQFAK
jgi:hypothetical protein